MSQMGTSQHRLVPQEPPGGAVHNGQLPLEHEGDTPPETGAHDDNRRSFFRSFLSSSGPPQIAIVIVLLTMSYGSVISILPKLMTERFARLEYDYDGADCNSYDSLEAKPEACVAASADAQNAAAVSELVANTLTLVTGSMIGAISDVHGRRIPFLVGITIASLASFALLYVLAFEGASPWVYYSVRSLHGLVNWMAVALASVADVLPPQLRAAGVGLFMAGFWGGVCVGPIVTLFLSTSHAIGLSCILAVVALGYAIVYVPETLPPMVADEARRKQEWSGHPRTELQSVCWYLGRPFRELSILNRNGFFRLLSTLVFFNGMVTAGDKTLLLYYVDYKLSFTAQDMAVMFLLFGVGAVVAQGVILKPLNDCLGERLVVIVCFIAAIFSNTIYGLANKKEHLFAGIVVGSLTSMAFPTFSAIKANNVDESEQGRIQGALYSMLALASGVGPIIMRYIDHVARNASMGSGSMFLFAAFLQLIASYFACQLPVDRSNSRSLARHERTQSTIDDIERSGRALNGQAGGGCLNEEAATLRIKPTMTLS